MYTHVCICKDHGLQVALLRVASLTAAWAVVGWKAAREPDLADQLRVLQGEQESAAFVFP